MICLTYPNQPRILFPYIFLTFEYLIQLWSLSLSLSQKSFDPDYVSSTNRQGYTIKYFLSIYTNPNLLQPHTLIIIHHSPHPLPPGELFEAPNVKSPERIRNLTSFEITNKVLPVVSLVGPSPGERRRRCRWCVGRWFGQRDMFWCVFQLNFERLMVV